LKAVQYILAGMKQGYYIKTPVCEPYFNMAADEWLFEKLRLNSKNIAAFLRIYSWSSPGITIGYNQTLSKAVDFDKLENNIPVIRRITGGRAIYHDQSEITFSLSLNLEILPESGRLLKESNRLVSEAVFEALEPVGLDMVIAKESSPSMSFGPDKTGSACFESHTKYEIKTGRDKIAAGAQRIIGNYLIHQGSLKVNGVSDCAAIGQVGSVFPGAAKSDDMKRGKRITIENILPGLVDGLSRGLRVDFKQEDVSPLGIAEYQHFLENFIENSLTKRYFG
jgi:lipoate-protein ligase A